MKIDQAAIKAAFEDISAEQAEDRSDEEASYIGILLEDYKSKTGRTINKVLNVPCGLGRHDKRLRELGFKVSSVDIDPDFIKIAKKRYPKFKKDYKIGSMGKLPYKTGSFDAVLCLYSSFNIPKDGENSKVLKEFAMVLRKGGILIMDLQNKGPTKAKNGKTFTSKAGKNMVKVVKVKFAGNYRVDDERLFLLDKNGSRKEIARETDMERLYSPGELRSLCESNGFSVLNISRPYSTSRLGAADTHMMIVAKRK